VNTAGIDIGVAMVYWNEETHFELNTIPRILQHMNPKSNNPVLTKLTTLLHLP